MKCLKLKINFQAKERGLCFADDTKLISSIGGIGSSRLLQEDLYRVINWSQLHNMELHEK